jgi:MFS transporter, Spinster family, sphingosine-1-phosphate transporter
MTRPARSPSLPQSPNPPGRRCVESRRPGLPPGASGGLLAPFCYPAPLLRHSSRDEATRDAPPDASHSWDRGSLQLVVSLTLLNLLSYVDRQMIAALAPLLIADLGLSRAQIGLLVGTSFIVVFAAATVAMGLAADRVRRSRLLAGGIAAWSVATGLTGTARGLASLAVWRAGVGVGEAALSPIALSLLADRFRPQRLGFVNGVFYAGIPLGFACSFALAGWMGPTLGWRACFYTLGLAGLAGVALAWRIDDPGRREPALDADARVDRLRLLRRLLAERPALPVLMLGGGLLAYASASSQHGVTWLVQERGLPYPRAAALSALVTASAGLLGNFGIGALTDHAHRRHPAGRPLGFAVIGALALAAAAAFYLLPPASALFLPCWFVAQAWLLGWYGPLLAAVLERCPAHLRASGAGLALVVINLLGVAIGPWATGAIGDRSSLTRGLLTSVAAGAVGLLLVAGVGLRALQRDSGAAST